MSEPNSAEGRLYDAYAQVVVCLSRLQDLYYDPIGPVRTNPQLREAIGFVSAVQLQLAERINAYTREREGGVRG